jgi:hypothetical protein
MTQESDGSWIDSPLVGRNYGTAMALLAMGELLKK